MIGHFFLLFYLFKKDGLVFAEYWVAGTVQTPWQGVSTFVHAYSHKFVQIRVIRV